MDIPTQLTIGNRNNQRYSFVQKNDTYNGNEVYFKGFNAYIEYTELKNPNNINSELVAHPAEDLTDYKFSILFTPRYIKSNIDDQNKIGQLGVESIINKKQKNILINLYLYVPLNSYTNLDFRKRDDLYNEKVIKYLNYDSITGEYLWKETNKELRSLTLNNLVRTFSNINKENDFFDEVNYTIIDENIKEFYIDSFTVDSNNNNNILVKFTKDIRFKDGQYIKFLNTNLNQFNDNIKIAKIKNNKTIIISFSSNQTNTVNTLNNIINDIIVTKEQSVLPFRFKIKYPQEIKINTDTYKIYGEKLDITPNNSATTITNLIYDVNDDGLIEHLHLNNDVSFKQVKESYRELSLSQLKRLPVIYRFSGDYEPILNDIEIFNKETLKHIQNVTFDKVQNIQIDGDFYIQLITSDIPNFNINDFIYIHVEHINANTNTAYIDYTSHLIKDIQEDNGEYIITLDTKYETQYLLVQDEININYGYTLTGVVSKIIDTNILFDNLYTNFGINRNVTIAKVYDKINILKSNKDVYDTTSKYPLIDEHGSTVINKNIFKSPWDLKYYYKIDINKFEKLP